jgi:hypothetical protein
MSKQKTKAVKKRAQRNRVIQVVVTEQLLERLKLRAASERRTLSQMAAIILQEGVDKWNLPEGVPGSFFGKILETKYLIFQQ